MPAILRRCNGIAFCNRSIETGEQKWRLRRDPCVAARLGEVLEKGRAKSGESGSILANARNNVMPIATVLRAKVYPMHQGHVRPVRGPRNLMLLVSGRAVTKVELNREADRLKYRQNFKIHFSLFWYHCETALNSYGNLYHSMLQISKVEHEVIIKSQ